MSYSLALSAFHQPLLGHPDVLETFSAYQDIMTMIAFEVALAKTQDKLKLIPKGTAARIETGISKFKLDESKLDKGMARDGVAVPALVEMLRESVAPADAAYVHKDATSQDVIDTSFMIRAQSAFLAIAEDVIAARDTLVILRKKHGPRNLMGRTRMQAALPITVGDRLDAWENAMAATANDISDLPFLLQFSGPVGTYKNDKLKDELAKVLGLQAPYRSWQNDRSPMLAIGNAASGLTAGFGKLGADIALMAQNELAEIKFSGGGTSSAMPHKQNPVKAEVLVSLARLNASLLSALHNAAVHEQERSGAAWTLEWLVLPQMICAAAGSARLARELLESVESIGA